MSLSKFQVLTTEQYLVFPSATGVHLVT